MVPSSCTEDENAVVSAAPSANQGLRRGVQAFWSSSRVAVAKTSRDKSATPSTPTKLARDTKPPKGSRESSCIARLESTPSPPRGTKPRARTTGMSSRHCVEALARQSVAQRGRANDSHASTPYSAVRCRVSGSGPASTLTLLGCQNPHNGPSFRGPKIRPAGRGFRILPRFGQAWLKPLPWPALSMS